MKLIPDKLRRLRQRRPQVPVWLKRLWRRVPRACVIATCFVLAFALGMVAVGLHAGPKYAGALTMVILWFTFLIIGAGAGFTILRLWYYRDNPIIKRVAYALHGYVFLALTFIVLLFMAKGVKFTWKFSITLFAGMALAFSSAVPLIVYVCKGDDPHASGVPERVIKPPASPDMNAPS